MKRRDKGMTVFAGDATSFHEWQFRLQIKKSLCKADELPALTAKVVDALRGEALSCAMEIGLAKLMEAIGLDLLVQKVQERLFPKRTAEARELLKQGMRIGGPMSRVPGEQMTSYISRRRRWWTLVHEMDNTLELHGPRQYDAGTRWTQPVRAEHGVDVYQRTTHHDSHRRSPARTALRRTPSWA